MKRPDKIPYYLNIAKAVSERSTCINKHYGAVIVKDDNIIATGYNGSPRGRKNCCDENHCIRVENNIPRGTRYELCRAIHAEANAIISASREQMIGSTLYLYGWDVLKEAVVEHADSCMMCKRMIINAGIKYVIVYDPTFKDNYHTYRVDNWTDSSLDDLHEMYGCIPKELPGY